jgi:hypothetical protein
LCCLEKIGERFPWIISALFIRKLAQHIKGFVEEKDLTHSVCLQEKVVNLRHNKRSRIVTHHKRIALSDSIRGRAAVLSQPVNQQ